MNPLADLLEAQLDPLLKQWVAEVGASLAPDRLRTPELTNHLPAFLRQVIVTLREPVSVAAPSPIDGRSRLGREHGAQRFRLGFELEAVVREYGVLLHLVLDLVEGAGTTVSVRELRRLIDVVTTAVAEATAEYARRLAATEVATEKVARRAAEATVIEQNRAMEALQLSEENFRALAEAIPQHVWTSTPEGALDFVNRRVLDYFHSTKERILGAGWQALIHPDDRSRSVERWARSLTTGEEYDLEFRLLRSDHTYRWHLARALPLRGPRGEIVKWVGTNTDIDETKRVREELEQRTKFEQHLLGIVSHDLRNPLGAILLGATGLLETAQHDEWVTKLAQRIHSSAERSVRMIGDLLDFTQARLGGGIRIERRPADLYALASAAVDEVVVAYPERAVELRGGGDTQGTWDADRIVQVMGNLVTNALKYSPSGTSVTVRTLGLKDTVEVTVHNEGPPIPPERLGSIFEPLQRATDEIDLKTRSVGLGLYIVQAIVLAHCGTVSVVSTTEAGTTFTVRLPREATDPPRP